MDCQHNFRNMRQPIDVNGKKVQKNWNEGFKKVVVLDRQCEIEYNFLGYKETKNKDSLAFI